MIAVRTARRRGIAAEALGMLQTWATGALGLRRFVAKVGTTNAPSLALFGRLGYTLVSTIAVFQEVRAALIIGASMWAHLRVAAQDTLELRLVDEAAIATAYAALRCVRANAVATAVAAVSADPRANPDR